jgi:hypothetical protein
MIRGRFDMATGEYKSFQEIVRESGDPLLARMISDPGFVERVLLEVCEDVLSGKRKFRSDDEPIFLEAIKHIDGGTRRLAQLPGFHRIRYRLRRYVDLPDTRRRLGFEPLGEPTAAPDPGLMQAAFSQGAEIVPQAEELPSAYGGW